MTFPCFHPPQIYAGPNGAVVVQPGADYAMYFTSLLVREVSTSHEVGGLSQSQVTLDSYGPARLIPVEDAIAQVDSLAGASIQELLAVIYQRLENSTNT